MNRIAQTPIRMLMTSLIISAGAALAQDYEIDWHTVDGGGEMWSSGSPMIADCYARGSVAGSVVGGLTDRPVGYIINIGSL